MALHICGSGMVGCADETCNNEVLKTPDSEFCIYDARDYDKCSECGLFKLLKKG